MHFKMWNLSLKIFGVCLHIEIKNLLQQYAVKVQKSIPILDLIKAEKNMSNIFNLSKISTLFQIGCKN